MLTGDIKSLLRTGLTRSFSSLFLKVAAAGLTYIAYVVLSRAMSGEAYGHFAFGLSLATVLAMVASLGQHVTVVRFWSEERASGNPASAENAVRAGSGVTLLAGLAIGLALIGATLVAEAVSGRGLEQAHLIAAALLVLPMALAEYQSAALRAQGSVWIALAPRDLAWRLCLPFAAWLWVTLGFSLDGAQALALAAGLLALSLMAQMLAADRAGLVLLPRFTGLAAFWRERGTVSLWFLIGAAIETVSLNADVVLVGLMVDLEQAGLYFNAFRTAALMTLFTFAIELVIAPMVAEHFHSGNLRKAQAVTTLCSWAGFAASLVIFIGFVSFGPLILSLFGEEYREGHLILLILAAGLLVEAATGPSKIVMMMTGHERAYVAIVGVITALGIALTVVLLPLLGLVGAAASGFAARAVSQIAIAVWCRRAIGIDTSILAGLGSSPRPIARPGNP